MIFPGIAIFTEPYLHKYVGTNLPDYFSTFFSIAAGAFFLIGRYGNAKSIGPGGERAGFFSVGGMVVSGMVILLLKALLRKSTLAVEQKSLS